MARSRQLVKLDDVALQAGVSPSTVSLYLRNPEKVALKTRQKIQSAIDHLGYVHNKVASLFTSGRSSTMAIIVPSVSNVIFSDAVQRIESAVSAAGYQLYIASHDHSLDKEEEQVRALLQWSPAVIALAGSRHKSSMIKMLNNSHTPVIQMWEVDGDHFPMQVGVNHFDIGYRSAAYLLASGCKKLAYVTTRLNEDIRSQVRYQGFCAALEAVNLKPVVIDIAHSDNIYRQSRALLLKILVNERGLDGIVTSNDAIATGLLMEAIACHINVPDQLSILGFGDFPYGGYLAPITLSSVNIHDDMIAEHTARIMLNMAENQDYTEEIIDVGFEIIPRQSTRIVF